MWGDNEDDTTKQTETGGESGELRCWSLVIGSVRS